MGEGKERHDRHATHPDRKRAARDCLQMPALRQGQHLFRLHQPAAELRGLRARLRLHGFRRWACDLHHHDRRRDRGRRRADRRGQVPAAVLAACGAVAAADTGHHAVAAALDEVAVDRAAVPPQGRAGSADRPRAEMNVRRAGFSLFTLAMVAVLLGLGVWQLQRRAEKHALMTAMDERLAGEPVDLPSPSQWNALKPSTDEFRRVRFTALIDPASTGMVYSSGSAVRDDITGPGKWVFMLTRLSGGEIVVVNIGFWQDPAPNGRAGESRFVSRIPPAQLTGYIRFPVSAGTLTPNANIEQRLWFTRDHLAMARALGWDRDGKAIAPFYIDLELPELVPGVKPGPLHVRLKDDHLQY